MSFHVVLVEPEIPTNTGNIGRLCVGMNAQLHLIEPLGFEISDRAVKRAGLDYWPHLKLQNHVNFECWWNSVSDKERCFFFTSKSERSLFDVDLQAGDHLVFGKETCGLDQEILKRFPDQCVAIPFSGPVRSFNLANAVAMALSEGARQVGTKREKSSYD